MERLRFTYDTNGNLLTSPVLGSGALDIQWTRFDMPSRITRGGVWSSFVYGAEHQRMRQERADGWTVYAGAQEVG